MRDGQAGGSDPKAAVGGGARSGGAVRRGTCGDVCSNVQLALILWVVSTLGGIGMLYWLRKLKERAEAERKAEGGDAPSAQ